MSAFSLNQYLPVNGKTEQDEIRSKGVDFYISTLILSLSDIEAEKRLFDFYREKWKKNMEG